MYHLVFPPDMPLKQTHTTTNPGDNTVQEVVAYTDGVINNNILSPGRSCDTPVSNLTVVRNIDIQIQQVLVT